MPARNPHDFPSLINGDRLPILILGSGMSKGKVSMVDDLIKKCPKVEEEYNCSTTVDLTDENDGDRFYNWAEQIVSQLEEKEYSLPKLELAKALGLTTDSKWMGKTELGLLDNTPHHRVIARLAREKRWKALWSLNWDCLLEAALESVGIDKRNETSLLPWPTSYKTFITTRDYDHSALENVITVHKPHGCVIALIEAKEASKKGNIEEAERILKRFKITKSDLARVPAAEDNDDIAILSKLRDQLLARSLIIAGWSVSEPYLKTFMENISADLQNIKELVNDPLSIIDIKFKDGHKRLARIYDVDENSIKFIVYGTDEKLTTDKLFLWIQTLYALEKIKIYLNGDALQKLEQLLEDLKSPNYQHYIIDWVDNFLPAWVRLCWRAELVPFIADDGQSIPSYEIRLEGRDEHIPWHISGIRRPDLIASSRLLIKLLENRRSYDYCRFPGALWYESEYSLIIPLPAWSIPNDLAGLKPLLNGFKQTKGYGFVRELLILPLMHDLTTPSADIVENLKESLARYLPIGQFAKSENIICLSLEDI